MVQQKLRMHVTRLISIAFLTALLEAAIINGTTHMTFTNNAQILSYVGLYPNKYPDKIVPKTDSIVAA
jgi:hypothetical protein